MKAFHRQLSLSVQSFLTNLNTYSSASALKRSISCSFSVVRQKLLRTFQKSRCLFLVEQWSSSLSQSLCRNSFFFVVFFFPREVFVGCWSLESKKKERKNIYM